VKDHYGLGFESHGIGKSARFGHPGANAGFQADFIMYRGGQGVAIMTNSDNGLQLIAEIVSSIGSVYGWNEYRTKEKAIFAMAPASYERFVGRYDLQGTLLTVQQSGGALFIRGFPGPAIRLYPESPSTFFMTNQDLDITFNGNAPGKAPGLLIRQNGITTAAKRVVR
jgi:hypothetical protein